MEKAARASVVISERPARVVSLVPEVADIIFAINAGDVLGRYR